MTTTKCRYIKQEEKVLITFMLEVANFKDRISSIPEVVYELDDGGMGTIKFTNNRERIYCGDILKVNYVDSDKIPVIIALTFDDRGDLFELDFWKVNFEKLLSYPEPHEIVISQD
ncbi:hypothetical protein MMU07_01710 [Aquiflexum sp. LQ15W]|uniref:DUF6984 family protein n=1 Tax=Cognataquiflexum nitidum TaxID=2922272 RepID=UPI001F133BC7|nr:hypothetical protein [Cognataquiflexum nitidum]MCH6198280.1 hypothetical protein [Cognataquiflexum nitidum]